MITQERLKETMLYSPDTGIFTWKDSGKGRRADRPAGCKNLLGYIVVRIDGSLYLAHRLATLYMKGYMPETTVDHVDRIRDNNKWDNLREASRQCQMRNCKQRSDNSSGIKGVRWNTHTGNWHARISVDGSQYNLGHYDDKLEAAYHRYAAEQCLGYPECDIKSSAKQFIDRSIVLRTGTDMP